MQTIGNYSLSVLETESFRLDGGAMFGSVPKTLWSKKIAADSENRIGLVSRSLILRDQSRVIVVDVGLGRKWTEKETQIYAIQTKLSQPLEKTIAGVTDVILTHLHFDHASGISYLDQHGTNVLSFPQARVFLAERNLTHAKNPNIRERASYLHHTLEPLQNSNLCFSNDGQEILPAISVFYSEGHTHGLQWVLIGEGKGAVAYPADMIPTAHHIPIAYVMGYDLCAETTMKEKAEFLKRAWKEEWVVVFEHDAETCAGTIHCDKDGRFSLGEVVPIETYDNTNMRSI